MAAMSRVKIKDGSTRYRVRVRRLGRSAHRTFRRKAEAQRWASSKEVEFDLDRATPLGRSEVITFGQVLEKYERQVLPYKKPRTQSQQYQQLVWWRNYFGTDTALVCCTAPMIADAMERMNHLSAKTINRYMSALSHLFSRCVKVWRCLDKNPAHDVERLPEGKGRTRFLRKAEREKLLAVCESSSNPLLYPIVVCALSSGARKGEIARMRWDKMDLWQTMLVEGRRVEIGRFLVEETKTGEPRYLVFFGEALKLLRQLQRQRCAGQIWCWPSPRESYRPLDFRYPWERALERTGIDNFCFHDLRHTTASYLGDQGATLPQIGELLGHKSVATTAKYTHFTQSSVAPLVARMDNNIFGGLSR